MSSRHQRKANAWRLRCRAGLTARRSLSGSCVRDFRTATSVANAKEMPRRHVPESRFPMAAGRDNTGSRPRVRNAAEAPDSLNDRPASTTNGYRQDCESDCRSSRPPRRTRTAWRSLSGSCAGDYRTALVKEKPCHPPTGTRSGLASGRLDGEPLPLVCTRGPLNGRPATFLNPRHQLLGVLRREPFPPERTRTARRSLSGSCAGDFRTALVKELPCRQVSGTRLLTASGPGDCGPRPLVCAHGPLNDCRACDVRTATAHTRWPPLHAMAWKPAADALMRAYHKSEASDGIFTRLGTDRGTHRCAASFR